MFRQTQIGLVLGVMILAACAGPDRPVGGAYPEPKPPDSSVEAPPYPAPTVPYPAPWQPAAGDDKLTKGEVFIETEEILVLESYPQQYMLHLTGTLPTPCNQLRVKVAEPNAQNQIQVEVYSLVDPAEICIQMLEPFDANLPLGSYSSGEYQVLVNDKPAGEIKP